MSSSSSTIRIPHLPSHIIHASLFHNVRNAAFLRQQLLDGNAEFEYAFLDASSILSVTHVLAACFRAINDALAGKLKSRNVHSEIVFALIPNNNIAESFRRFGVTDTTTSLLAIKVLPATGTEAEQTTALDAVAEHLQSNVEGELLPFGNESLQQGADLAKIRKTYKIPAEQKVKGQINGEASVQEQIKRMEGAVLGSMAIKGS